MSSKEEDKYFQEVERERRERLRRERELDAIRQVERDGIAQSLSTSEEVAAEALELGFDADTARVLPLMPLIEVAWADGSVSLKEERTILAVATDHGLEEGSPAYNFMTRLFNERPSELFFERTNRVLMHMAKSDPKTWKEMSLPELCRQVAEASGGFLGVFGEKISVTEMALINELAAQLEVATKTGAQLSVYPSGDEQ